jgi:hypothetical protein
MDRLYRVHGYIMYQCNHFHVEHGTANIWRLRKVKSMTREEAIKWLSTFQGRYGLNELEEAIDMAIKALEEPQWIPCSVKYPDPDERVLITRGGYDYYV